MNNILSTLLASLSIGLNPSPSLNEQQFNKNVRPVIEAKCTSCHAALAGQDWTKYSTAKRAISRINFRVFVLQNMPPSSAPSLTGQEKSALKSWIDAEKAQ